MKETNHGKGLDSTNAVKTSLPLRTVDTDMQGSPTYTNEGK